ncbi:MAG: pilus assembly protein PilM [Bacillota bacterium]
MLKKKNNSKTKKRACKKIYSAIGVDLGDKRIKFLQLEQKNGQLAIFAKCIIASPPGTINHGKIIDPGPLLKELKRIKKAFNWQGKEVCLALNSRACYMRKVKMPGIAPKELSGAMELEAENSFPPGIEQLVTGYCTTSFSRQNDDKSSCPDYLLAAVEKEVSDTYSRLFLGAGFYPAAIETAPVALLRSLHYDSLLHKPPHNNRRLLLDCGYSSTTLLLISGSSYRFHRSLNLGIEDFLKALKDKMPSDKGARINPEKLLFEKRSMKDKGISVPAGKMAKSINQSLDYIFEIEAIKESELPPLEVCGGGIFIPDLPSYLQDKLNLKLLLYDPLKTLKQSSTGLEKLKGHEGAFFHLAHGLALRGWS